MRANFVTTFVTTWDVRAALRAFGGAMLALAVVWLITAATDEGQLGLGERAGRTLPLAPLCSAVGVALALGTARVRAEVRALESLGRSPGESARAAAFGAAVPSVVMAVAIAAAGSVDVGGFYPRAPRTDDFVREESAFVGPSLGVRVGDDGETAFADDPRWAKGAASADANLPRFARIVAATTTALAGIALTLVASRAVLRPSLSDKRTRRRGRVRAGLLVLGCALATLFAFQAAAAGIAPAAIAILPPLLLLVFEIAQRRMRYGSLA